MKQKITVFIIFLLFTFGLSYPMCFSQKSKISDDYDGLLITWIINRVQDNVLSGNNLFSGNILSPYKNTLAFSDLFLTDSLVTLPVKIITNEPLVVYNVSQLLGLFLTACFTYLLVFHLTKNQLSSFLAGFFASFSGFHLHYLTHLQVFNYYFLPIFILFLLKWTETQKVKWLIFSFFCFVLTSANSFFTGYLLIAVLTSMLIFLKDLRTIIFKNKKIIFVLIILSGLILAPLVIPYFQVSREFHAVRSIRESANFSLGAEEIFSKYHIITLQVLFLIALIMIFKNKKNPIQKSLLLVSAISTTLSLGPVLKMFGKTVHQPFIIPLPYAVFYYILPGFQGFRTPSRWFLLAGFTVSILTGMEFGKWIIKRRLSLKFSILLSIIILTIYETGFPRNFITIPQKNNYPKVYDFLKTQNKNTTVLELPIYDWSMVPFAKNEAYRMVYSLDHQKKMLNGYTGFFPDEWLSLVRSINNSFPDKKTVKQVKDKKVTLIVVHKKEYEILAVEWDSSWGRKLVNIQKSKSLKIIWRGNSDEIYQVL